MNYAIVENGVVSNVILWDGKSTYVLPTTKTLVSLEGSDAWIGWTYDGTTFTAPEEPTDS